MTEFSSRILLHITVESMRLLVSDRTDLSCFTCLTSTPAHSELKYLHKSNCWK